MGGNPEYIPTPAEIKAECEKIRATWSEAEERRRRYIATHHGVRPAVEERVWTPPTVSDSGLGSERPLASDLPDHFPSWFEQRRRWRDQIDDSGENTLDNSTENGGNDDQTQGLSS